MERRYEKEVMEKEQGMEKKGGGRGNDDEELLKRKG